MSTSTLLAPCARMGSRSKRAAAHALLRFAMLGLALAATGAASAAPTYVLDGGLISRDAFAGSETRNYIGQKLVSLDDGSVVVAGIVPSTGGQGTSIGLVHYNATTGARVPWTNPGQYGFYGNQYIVYPNVTYAEHTEVRSIVHHNGFFYVLSTIGSRAHEISIFKDSGEYVTSAGAGGPGEVGGPPDVSGGDIAAYRIGSALTGYSHWLVYGGTVSLGSVARPIFRRFQIQDDGSLHDETGAVYPNPGNYCPNDRSCYINAIAIGKDDSLDPGVFPHHPRVYLAGSRWSDANNWDFLIMALNHNGGPELGFNTVGVTVHAFDDGGNKNDSAYAIATSYEQLTPDPDSADDEIYLVGGAGRTCGDGIGVAAFDGTGHELYGFQPFILGGTGGSGQLCNPALPRPAHFADAAIVDGKNLVISGMQVMPCRIPLNCQNEPDVDGLLTVVNRYTEGPAIPPIETFPYTDTIGGPRTRHGRFSDVVASGNGKYTVAGDVRTFESAAGANDGVKQYAKARLMLDSIFANGFEH